MYVISSLMLQVKASKKAESMIDEFESKLRLRLCILMEINDGGSTISSSNS